MYNMIRTVVKKYSRLYNLLRDIQIYQRRIRIKYFYKYTIKKDFYKNNGYKLNLDNPRSFNEKLQWLKYYYRDDIMEKCSDKVAARGIIADFVGEKYLVPLYGVYDSFEEIDFTKLPEQFVLKPSHSSGRVVICKDKKQFDMDDARNKFAVWLKENYYYQNGEWVYKNIVPHIVCEQLLGGEIIDYKFMCFHGEPYIMFTCTEREVALKVTFFDMDFNRLPFIRKYISSNKHIEKPQNWELMIELSRLLSKRFPFTRVDFYENNGKLFVGELTFFPGNGMEWFEPIEWDYKIGEKLDLTKIGYGHD